MSLRVMFTGLLATLLLSVAAEGQAVVTGTVISGNRFKPVSGIEVHLVNKTFKPPIDRTVLTGADGSYAFEEVAPGENYAVDIIDPTGKLVGTDKRFVVLPSTTEHTAVPEIDISRGVTAERAEQSGGLIENDRGVSPGANISNEQLRVLPLYNRNFLALGLIQPGVHDVEQGSPLQGAGFSIAGSRSTSTNFLLDGVDNVASNNNQAIPFQVNEAVREFRVTYATPSMRYGQGSGGVVEVLTSSGDVGSSGKAFHGSVFGYFNSDALNANQPLSVYSNSGFARASAYANNVNAGINPSVSNVIFADASGAPAPSNCNFVPTGSSVFCGYSPQSYNALYNLFGGGSSLDAGCKTSICIAGVFNPATSQDSRVQPINSKQFGGSVGGPVGPNRYLFASYEGTLINNPTPIFERVPTALDTANLPPLAAMETNDAALAQATLRLFPAANLGQTGPALIPNSGTGVMGFYRGQAPNYTNVHTVQIRPDLSLNALGTVSLRYTGQLLDQLHDDTLPASGSYPGNGADRRAQNQNAAITYNFPFRQHRNLLSIAFTQYRVDEVAQDRNFVGNPLNLATRSMPTVVLAGIDPQTSAVTKGGQGAIGGWYDSFWNTNCNGVPVCSGINSASRSPSPITPSLDGNFPFARLGAPLSAPSKRRDTEAFLSDALDLHLGERNTLTVGGEYRYQQNFSFNGGMARGLIVTNNIGEFTSDSETCVSCNPKSAFSHPSFDYELRQPAGYTGDLRSSSFGLFAENKFQPTDRMTLVAGVRYDYFGQQLDTGNRLWNYNATNYGLNRQGGTGTFDPFDYQCGGGITFFDAVYGSLRASTPSGKWACNQAGTFQLPQDKHNVAGLFGIAYSPDSGNRQVLRASIGAYYDHLPASYNQTLLKNRPTPYNANSPSAIYGQNFASSYSSSTCQVATSCGFGLSTLNFSNASPSFQNYQAASSASILYQRDPNALKTPLLVQFSTSYQYRFSGSWTGEANYTGSIGQRLPLVYDSNFANEFYCNVNGVCNNNTYFPVFTESNIGVSNYNSVIARVEGRLWHGLSMHASFTLAKSLDDIAGSNFPDTADSLFPQLFGRQLYGLGNPAVFALQASSAGYGSNGGLRGTELASNSFGTKNTNLLQSVNIPSFDAVQSALTTTGSRAVNVSRYSLPQNPLAFSSSGNPSGADYGRSDFDVRQRGVADFVYNLPDYGHRLMHGFTLTGITTFQSGQPFTIFSGPAYGQVTQLVNRSAAAAAVHTTGNPNGYIAGAGTANLPSLNNPSCPNLYAQPSLYLSNSVPAACAGNGGRNSFTGPAFFSQDMALQKATFVRGREGQAVTLRAEFYNVFNRANYYNPISELSNDGVHINPEFGLIRSAHDPFQMQLAVRYGF